MKAYSLNIGLTNRCNLSCYFCPVRHTKIEREDMSFELAKKIIDAANGKKRKNILQSLNIKEKQPL